MLSAEAHPLQADLEEHVAEFRKVTADLERLKAQTQAAERKLAHQVCSLERNPLFVIIAACICRAAKLK